MVRVARRKELAREGKMGCPRTLNYPLDSRTHVLAAMKYYKRKDTVKCEGFWNRWCKAAENKNVTKIPTFKEKCKH